MARTTKVAAKPATKPHDTRNARNDAERLHAANVAADNHDKQTLPEMDAEEAGEAPKATPKQLAKIVELARSQIRLERAVTKAEEVLKKAKQELQVNTTVELPKALKDAGLKGTPLGGGAYVEMKQVVSASIPSPNSKAEDAAQRNKAGIEYMEQLAPDLIDTTLTLRFRPGDEKELERLLKQNARRKHPLEYEFKRVVNGNSLSAWVRKRDEQALPTDADKINIHRIDMAKVVLPKKGKDKV